MRDFSFVKRLKLSAGILLAISALLPLSSLPVAGGEKNTFTYAWKLATDDWIAGVWLGLAYFWPALLVPLRRHLEHQARGLLVCIAELVLAAASAMFLIGVSTIILSWEFAIPWVPWSVVPVTGRTAVGGWLAVGADGLYVLACMTGLAGMLISRKRALGNLTT